MEKTPCSPCIMHRECSVELCTEGVQRATLQKWTAMIYFKLGFLSKRGG